MTYWPSPLTSGKQPSITPLITSPLSGGSANGPPRLVALMLGSARLLRLQALHQRHYRFVPLFDYISGEANVMADACNRLWHLSDSQLLAHFSLHYPQSRP
jgi:hypothetical protein